MNSLTLGTVVMFAMIFCVAYRTFPIFSSVDVIFISARDFLLFCFCTTDFLFFPFWECRYLRLILSIFMPFFIDWEFHPIDLLFLLLLFSLLSAHLRIIAIFPFYI